MEGVARGWWGVKTGYKIYSGEGGDKNAYIYKHLILGEFKKAVPNIGVVYREFSTGRKKLVDAYH